MQNIFLKSDHSRTSNTTSFLDHILTSSLHAGKHQKKMSNWCRNFWPSINLLLTEALMTNLNMHNQIRVLSLKNCTHEPLTEELTKINFLDYNIFSNVDIVYLQLIEEILSIVNKTASFKDLRIKNKTQKLAWWRIRWSYNINKTIYWWGIFQKI